jgi:hypothetical protein
MKLLRDSDEPIVSIAADLGYSSQTAFAAASALRVPEAAAISALTPAVPTIRA